MSPDREAANVAIAVCMVVWLFLTAAVWTSDLSLSGRFVLTAIVFGLLGWAIVHLGRVR